MSHVQHRRDTGAFGNAEAHMEDGTVSSWELELTCLGAGVRVECERTTLCVAGCSAAASGICAAGASVFSSSSSAASTRPAADGRVGKPSISPGSIIDVSVGVICSSSAACD